MVGKIKNWYKKAQFTEENTPNVNSPTIIIEPFESIVQDACDEIVFNDSTFFQGVNKITLESDPAFGHVSSKNPADINIDYYKVKNSVEGDLGHIINPDDPQDLEVLKEAIKDVIVHERAHVTDASQQWGKSPENFATNPFPGGEGVAEQAERTFRGI